MRTFAKLVALLLLPASAMAVTLDSSQPNGPEFMSALNVLARVADQEAAKSWLSLSRIISVEVEERKSDKNQMIYTFAGISGMNASSEKLQVTETKLCSEPTVLNGFHGGCHSEFVSSIIR